MTDITQAMSLFENAQYEAAEKILRTLYPENLETKEDIEIAFCYALCLFQQTDLNEAKKIFQNILAIYPNEEVKIWELECRFYLGDEEGIHNEAYEWYEKTDNIDLAAIALRSVRLMGKWRLAQKLVQLVLADDTNNPSFLAEALLFQIECPYGDKVDALTHLMQINEHYPNSHKTIISLIQALIRNKEFEKAISLAQNYILKQSGINKIEAQIYLAWAFIKNNQADNARETSLVFNNKLPQHPVASIVNGYIAYSEKNYIRSINYISNTINKYEGFTEEVKFGAEILTKNILDTENGLNAYKKLFTISEGSFDDHLTAVWLAYQQDDLVFASEKIFHIESKYGKNIETDIARSLFEPNKKLNIQNIIESIRKTPKEERNIFSLYFITSWLTSQKEYKKAENSIQKAFEKFPRDILLSKALVDIKMRQEKWEEALNIGEDTLHVYPVDHELRSQVLLAASKLNNEEKLIEHDSKIIKYSYQKHEEWLSNRIREEKQKLRLTRKHSKETLHTIWFLYINAALLAKTHTKEGDKNCARMAKVAVKYFTNLPKQELKKIKKSDLWNHYLRLKITSLLCEDKIDEAHKLILSDEFKKYPDKAVILTQILILKGMYSTAYKYAQQLIKKAPTHPASYDILTYVAARIGLPKEKVCHIYDEALKLNPNHTGIKWNYSCYLRFIGDVKAADPYIDVGLSGQGGREPFREFQIPMWQGESLAGKTLFIWREQGIGDELIWTHFWPSIIERALKEGGHIKIDCSERLLSLFRRSFPSAEIHAEDMSNDLHRTDIDYHIPMMSLWRHAEIEYYPCKSLPAWLVTDPKKRQVWQQRIQALRPNRVIGLAWRSMSTQGERKLFYPSIEDLGELFKLKNTEWVMLNYHDYQKDAAEIKERYGITLHLWPDLDLKNDFESMAAQMEQLDLVISATLTPGGLARCMGIENWLVAPGAEILNTPPHQNNHTQYPAHIWQKHHTETYGDIFKRMVEHLEQHQA